MILKKNAKKSCCYFPQPPSKPSAWIGAYMIHGEEWISLAGKSETWLTMEDTWPNIYGNFEKNKTASVSEFPF